MSPHDFAAAQISQSLSRSAWDRAAILSGDAARKTFRLKGEPGTIEFMLAYQAALGTDRARGQ